MKKTLRITLVVIFILILTCPNEKDLNARLEFQHTKIKVGYNFFVCKTFKTSGRTYLGILGNFIWLN